MSAQNQIRYASFAKFYPYYLSEHSNRTCRRLHFIGTTLGLAFVLHAFTHPFYSFMGDWVMWKDILTGKIHF